jgi:hypothetical protein
MTSWRAKAGLLAGAALLIALPAFSQESPESLLPPGFGDPQTLPPPAERTPAQPQTPRPDAPRAVPQPAEQETGTISPEEALLERPRPTNYFSIPEGEARPVDIVGLIGPGGFGLSPNAFGNDRGALSAEIMRRVDAPLPSRWTSILLRRALMSRLQAPAGIDPADWVAERADLLLRMGEADAARMLVQQVDQQYYTPRLVEVAARTALATADPAALCPLIGSTRTGSRSAVWSLAEAMCAALESEPARAAALVDQARSRGGEGGIDLALAEKVIGAGAASRRAAALSWDGVNQLTLWRFGLASATGTEIPAPLIGGAGLPMRAWFARAPMVPVEQRVEAASIAAALGILSSNALVQFHSLVFDRTDIAEQGGTVASRLRTAWIGASPAERVTALRGLWTEPADPRDRYARLILTAGAASRIPVSSDHVSDAANLVAAMLSAGMDADAARWAETAQGDDRAWAMLAVGASGTAADLGAGRIENFINNDGSAGRIRARMLVAALIGLGRIGEADGQRLASAAGLSIGEADRWAEAIDQAARQRQPGTVALLAGLGMQTDHWASVPPRHLFRIVRALRAVGLEYEARMIAAEAMARL